MKIANATFSASRKNYSFTVYSSDTRFRDVSAVYIFTKRTVKSNGKVTHKFLYIGESGELGTRIANHDKWHCVNHYDCNCICVLRVDDSHNRRNIEKVFRNEHETPCNDQ